MYNHNTFTTLDEELLLSFFRSLGLWIILARWTHDRWNKTWEFGIISLRRLAIKDRHQLYPLFFQSFFFMLRVSEMEGQRDWFCSKDRRVF